MPWKSGPSEGGHGKEAVGIYAWDAMKVGARRRRSWEGGRGDICMGCHGSRALRKRSRGGGRGDICVGCHGSRGPQKAVMGRRPCGYAVSGIAGGGRRGEEEWGGRRRRGEKVGVSFEI